MIKSPMNYCRLSAGTFVSAAVLVLFALAGFIMPGGFFMLAGTANAQVPAVSTEVSAGSYLGPSAAAFINDSTLVVLQQDARAVDWYEFSPQQPASLTPIARVPLPAKPHRMTISQDNQTIFVSCGDIAGVICQINVSKRKIVRTWGPVHSPAGLAFASETNTLYVGRLFHNDILAVPVPQNTDSTQAADSSETADSSEVIDLSDVISSRRVAVLREPATLVLAPNQQRLFVGNFLPDQPANGSIVASSISILDLTNPNLFDPAKAESSLAVRHIPLSDGANSIRGMAVSQDGRYVFAVHTQANHRSITSQLAGGWTSRNGLSILDVENPTATTTYLVDGTNIGAPNPWDVQVSPDGKLLAVAFAGCREVGFIDTEALIEKLHRDRNGMISGHGIFFGVGSLVQSMMLIKVESLVGPRAIAMSDGFTCVAGYFSDNIAIFKNDAVFARQSKGVETSVSGKALCGSDELGALAPEVTALGPSPVWDSLRRGEVLFHDSECSLENWHSCATCHPDARVDGHNWDLLNDGIGNHKSTKSMLYSHVTPPNMITGIRASGEVAVRAGYIHIHFIPLTESKYTDVDNYLKALKPIPGPAILPDGTLSESARRGKRLFFSSKTGCSTCHNGPYYTDLKLHDVLTENSFDMGDREFDTPTLIEIHRTGPYLHDGRYTTLSQLMFEGYHGDPDHKLDALTDQQKSDLIEFLLSL